MHNIVLHIPLQHNTVVVGEQYQEPPIIDIQFPNDSDLVNYTRNENVQFITIPSSLIKEKLKEAGNNGIDHLAQLTNRYNLELYTHACRICSSFLPLAS